MSILYGFVFGAWFCASLAVYIPGLKEAIRWLDQMYLIPEWRFFAPNPGRHDFYLLYRDWTVEGEARPWVQLLQEPSRHLSQAVWNPSKREHKAVLDIVSALGAHLAAEPETISLSIPYLSIVNYISESLIHSEDVKSTQFMVMQSAGSVERAPDPSLVFVSQLHDLV